MFLNYISSMPAKLLHISPVWQADRVDFIQNSLIRAHLLLLFPIIIHKLGVPAYRNNEKATLFLNGMGNAITRLYSHPLFIGGIVLISGINLQLDRSLRLTSPDEIIKPLGLQLIGGTLTYILMHNSYEQVATEAMECLDRLPETPRTQRETSI